MGIKTEPVRRDKRTCLYERHVALGATMVSFGGFDMPLLYQYAGLMNQMKQPLSLRPQVEGFFRCRIHSSQ